MGQRFDILTKREHFNGVWDPIQTECGTITG